MNFGSGDDVLLNPPSLMAELAEEMAERGIVPEYECFDIGMAVTAAKLANAATAGRAPGMMHLLLGVTGGAPAERRDGLAVRRARAPRAFRGW